MFSRFPYVLGTLVEETLAGLRASLGMNMPAPGKNFASAVAGDVGGFCCQKYPMMILCKWVNPDRQCLGFPPQALVTNGCCKSLQACQVIISTLPTDPRRDQHTCPMTVSNGM